MKFQCSSAECRRKELEKGFTLRRRPERFDLLINPYQSLLFCAELLRTPVCSRTERIKRGLILLIRKNKVAYRLTDCYFLKINQPASD